MCFPALTEWVAASDLVRKRVDYSLHRPRHNILWCSWATSGQFESVLSHYLIWSFRNKGVFQLPWCDNDKGLNKDWWSLSGPIYSQALLKDWETRVKNIHWVPQDDRFYIYWFDFLLVAIVAASESVPKVKLKTDPIRMYSITDTFSTLCSCLPLSNLVQH